jgi:hypothetical protein
MAPFTQHQEINELLVPPAYVSVVVYVEDDVLTAAKLAAISDLAQLLLATRLPLGGGEVLPVGHCP